MPGTTSSLAEITILGEVSGLMTTHAVPHLVESMSLSAPQPLGRTPRTPWAWPVRHAVEATREARAPGVAPRPHIPRCRRPLAEVLGLHAPWLVAVVAAHRQELGGDLSLAQVIPTLSLQAAQRHQLKPPVCHAENVSRPDIAAPPMQTSQPATQTPAASTAPTPPHTPRAGRWAGTATQKTPART